MLWKRRTAASKQDHRVVVGCVLGSGIVLPVLAGAGNDGESVAAGSGSGMRGTRAGGQQGRENRAGAKGEGRVEVIPAGGGAAAAAAERRPEAKHCADGRRSRAAHARGRRREGGGPGGLFENFRNLRDLSIN
jgi:hypothetical protein